MRIACLSIFFVLLSVETITAREVPAYRHHTFELSVTPTFDYHFITWPDRAPGFERDVNNLNRPLAGFNVGFAYIYRPIRLIGISTGFNFLEYGIKLGKEVLETSGGSSPDIVVNRFKGFILDGYIDVPLLIHVYTRINKTELDWATGPELLFPVINISKYSALQDSSLNLLLNRNNTKTLNSAQTLKYSWLGWTLQLAARIPVNNFFEMSIGPEMKFLTIHPFEPGSYYNSIPHEIDFYIGLKIGFRLGSDFYRKKKETGKNVVSQN